MNAYIALLRGINLGGKNKIKMDELCHSLHQAGFSSVQSYIQSGNIVLDSDKKSKESVANEIRSVVYHDLSIDVPVVVLDRKNLQYIIKNNTFIKNGLDPSKLHVSIFSGVPDKHLIKKIKMVSKGGDHIFFKENFAYLYCPNGYGQCKLSNNYLEKILNVQSTTRNWKTMHALLSICEGQS